MMIGARVGANIGNEAADSLSSVASNSTVLGMLGGLQFDYLLDDTWALSLQVLYDQNGASSRYNSDFATGYVNMNLNYIEIPLVLRMSFGTGELRPYVFIGPSMGILLSGIQNTSLYIREAHYYSFGVSSSSLPIRW